MTHYDHLIIGGGMAADAAAHGIRERDEHAGIGILSEEPTAPFPRPALSKKLWTDPDFTVENTTLDTVGETGATFHPRTRVVAVDPAQHEVTTQDGDTIGYGRLLVATGGHPRTLTDLPGGDRVLYYRSLTDYHRLRVLADTRPHVAVVGGGYIGTEIAAAMVGEGCRVTLLHPGDVLGEQMFPAELADRFERLFTEAGVEVRGGAKVSGGREHAEGVRLDLESGDQVEADVVVIGLGVEPATHFLPDSVERSEEGGVVVDEHLRTSAADVYAAGDVASYPDPILGRTRVEHVDNATTMGTAAGRIMAGSDETYDHTPMFYSDVLGLGYQAVGTLDASLETFVEHVGEGAVAYYLDDSAVVGVLLWDLDEGVEEAKQVLARHWRPEDPAALAGSITAPTSG